MQGSRSDLQGGGEENYSWQTLHEKSCAGDGGARLLSGRMRVDGSIRMHQFGLCHQHG